MSTAFNAGALCQRDVVTVDPSVVLSEAARLMRERHVGCLVVVDRSAPDERQAVGMLTDRDIVTAVVAKAMDATTLRVADVMEPDIVTVRHADSLMDVLATMRRHGVRRVPVTGPLGHLMGLLTLDDVIAVLGLGLHQVVEIVRSELQREPRTRP